MLVTAQHSSCALSPQLSDNHGDLECRYPGTETQTRRGEEPLIRAGTPGAAVNNHRHTARTD